MNSIIETALHYWPFFIVGGTIVVYLVTVSRPYEKAGVDPYLDIEEDGKYTSVNKAYIETQKKIEADYMLRDSHHTVSKDADGFDIRVDYGTKGYHFIAEEEK